MTRETLDKLIAAGESLELEFKSDRGPLSDHDIYEQVVALASTAGGVLLIGVEDDGTVTGAHPRHGQTTDPVRLQAAIFNNTVPNINTRVSVVPYGGASVIAVEVQRYPVACATASGKALRRVTGPNGKPATVPFYPRDQLSRDVDLGLLDFSAQPLEGVAFDGLDPLEFERLRKVVGQLRGDQNLLELSDEDVAKALRLVETRKGNLVPNVAGLLLLGREEVLREALPTHEVHFQVLDEQENVKVNDVFHGPVLRVLSDLETRFRARNEEQEVTVGLFRLPVPDYSPEGFREALNNAVLHRDYARLGAVYVQWLPDHMLLTNPGSFPEGITVDNILVHEPKPRNPRLAEAFKRIGLIEQTGRGVDRIYMGQLRYGRPVPDYTRSDADGVRVILRGGQPSLEFAALVFEQEQQNTPLSLDELIILNGLFHQRRLDSEEACRLTQQEPARARAVLERLSERGFIEARGEGRGRAYMLSSALYQRLHMEAEYVRAKGFDRLQHEQMVLDYVRGHGSIRRSEAADLCQISGPRATRLLAYLVGKHPQLRRVGKKRGAHYVWDEGHE